MRNANTKMEMKTRAECVSQLLVAGRLLCAARSPYSIVLINLNDRIALIFRRRNFSSVAATAAAAAAAANELQTTIEPSGR